ncbi:hypothetical protein J7M00_03460 [bacterium]|nr:hypothetical protein [bacterium]
MKRYNLQLNDAAAAMLQDIMRKTDAPSMAAVLRDAIVLYSWALEQVMKGNTIVSISETNERQELVSTTLKTAPKIKARI